MNVTNVIIAGAFAVQGCSLDAKVSEVSTPNTETSVETEVSSTPSSDAKSSAEYDTSNLGNLGFVRIDGESVKFVHDPKVLFTYIDGSKDTKTINNLVVISTRFFNGTYSVDYYDNTGNDLQIEQVVIQQGDLTLTYNHSVPEDQQYIAGAQKQFDAYLNKILVRKEELRQETLAKKKEFGTEVLLGQH